MKVSRAAPIIGILFLLVGLAGVIGVAGAWLRDSAIVRSGIHASGHVTGKQLLFSADGDSDYLLSYWFLLPDGRRIETKNFVPKGVYDTTASGQTIEVLYSAQDPQRNFPRGAGVTSPGLTLYVAILAALFAISGAVLLFAWFRARAAQRLATPD